MRVKILDEEYWYGGIVSASADMPYDKDTHKLIVFNSEDQAATTLISSKGRAIVSDNYFEALFDSGDIIVDDDYDVEFIDSGKNLRDVVRIISERKYKNDGKIPNGLFFRVPQYNTWIELMYNQNEKQILEYAKAIIDNGMEPGILMIDEGWAEGYCSFDFHSGRFPDPKGMVKRLHDWGFKVMLWVIPVISPDSNVYRELRDTDYLIKDKDGKLALRKWWNGYSCVLDLTNPDAYAWFKDKLDYCRREYEIDGFKFDGGDAYFYDKDDMTHTAQSPFDSIELYNKFGADFEFNEFRVAYNVNGKPIVCRLQDKFHSWEDKGLNLILPNTILQGLAGVLYGCPDMIGGGAYSCFKDNKPIDQELYIRWIEASVFCPMMQFSVAPWRILSEENLKIVKKYVELHMEISDSILELARNAALTGEPIIRHMEYVFPGEGFEKTFDQFMFGDDVLVAPVLTKGATERTVRLPRGVWYNSDGEAVSGGQVITVNAPLSVLPVFYREKR